MVLTAINSDNKNAAFKAYQSTRTASKDIDTGLYEFPRLNKTQLDLLLHLFIEKHPYLENGFCSDRGIELMFMDSQIADIIITKFLEQNEPVLTVHDSYIVKADNAQLLEQTMAEATATVFNNRLPAEQDGQLTREQTKHVLNQFRQHDFETYLELVGRKLPPQPHKPIQTNRYKNDLRKFTKWRER